MSQLQERWEGVSLPGDYLLQQWVSGDDRTGFFDALQGEETGPAAPRFSIKVVAQADADGSGQLAIWQRTRELDHPNLRRLVDFGRAELDGQIVLYAVMEKADDSLSSGLSQGPISEPEAREVLNAAISAMRYLQDRGLTMASLDPDHVLAVGDAIKLDTDELKVVPLETPFRHELGVFWDQVSPSSTVRRRAILSEALGEEPVPVEVPPLAVPKPVQTTSTASSLAEARAASGSVTAPPDQISEPSGGLPKWVFVGAAAVVLLILGLNLRRAPDTPAQAGSAPPTPVSTTIVAKPASPSAARPDAGTKPSPLDAATRTSTTRAASGQAMWRVIAFTYKSEGAAQRKVDQVNRTSPDLAATVFSPREKQGYYLVALGGRMTHEAAVRLQKKARAGRVAHDAYIQNYLD